MAGIPQKTLADLVRRYETEGKAAGAVALQIESLTAAEYQALPASFRCLIGYKQQIALIKLGAMAAGTSLHRLQEEWVRQDVREQDRA